MPYTVQRLLLYLMSILALCITMPAHAATVLKEDQQHVTNWNRFAERLYELHKYNLQKHQIYKETETGGYASQPEFYTEVSYYDSKTDRLLSRIQWETQQPDTIHTIAVYVYDKQGRLLRDYLAAYLPKYRNAPVQTLINLHFSDEELTAFRQFDASGNRIYEQCRGRYFGKPMMLALEDHEIPAIVGYLPKSLSQELYEACFSEISAEAGKYLNPLIELKAVTENAIHKRSEQETLTAELERLNRQIEQDPDKVQNYIKRAQRYFYLHEFDAAINDLDRAIQLDDEQDQAYFWRGMVHGRNGRIDQGIADLTEYIKRVPDSSQAYTKRGVRYIWNGEIEKAKRDLQKAIELDRKNAEAYDDLGVIYAQQGKFHEAVFHFNKVIEFDPTYQKAYHNLAMTRHIQDRNPEALRHIDRALALRPESKNSLTLKAEILKSIGQHKQASVLLDRAAFLPEENWSEQWPD